MDDRYTIRITTQSEQAQQDIDRLNKSLVKLGTTKISTAQVQKLHRSFIQTGGDINVLNRNISAVNGLLKSGFSTTQIQKLRQKAQETGTQFAQLARLAKQTGTVGFDTTNLQKGSKLINSITQGINKSFSAIALKAAVVTAAVVGIGKALGDMANQASEAQQAMIKLNSAFGGNYAEVSKFQKYAQSLQDLISIEDDIIINNIAIAKSFNNMLSDEQLEQITRLAVGLQKVKDIDIEKAFEMASKAYGGNYRALQQLVPSIRNAKTQQQKYNALVSITNQLFDDAITLTDTYKGKLDQIKLKIDDAKQTIGNMVTNIAQAFIDLDNSASASSNALQMLANIAASVLGAIALVVTGLSSIIAGAVALVVNVFKTLFDMIVGIGTNTYNYFKNIFLQIKSNVTNIIESIKSLFKGKFEDSLGALKKIKLSAVLDVTLDDNIGTIKKEIKQFGHEISIMADTIGDTMTNVWDKITQVKPLPNVKSTNLVNNQNNDDSSNDANAKATDKTVAATKQLNHQTLAYIGLSRIQKQILNQTNEVLKNTNLSITTYDESIKQLNQEIAQNNKEIRSKNGLLEIQQSTYNDLVHQYNNLTPQQQKNSQMLKQNIQMLGGMIESTQNSIELIKVQTSAFQNQISVLDQQNKRYKELQISLNTIDTSNVVSEFSALQSLGSDLSLSFQLAVANIQVELQDTLLTSIKNVANEFGYAISNMISGTKSFSESMKQLWKSLVSFIIKEITAMIVQYLILIAVKTIALGPLNGTGFGSFLLGVANGGLGLLNTNNSNLGSTTYPNQQLNITYSNQNSITKKLDKLIDAVQNFEPVQTQIISPRVLANVNKLGNAMLIQGT